MTFFFPEGYVTWIFFSLDVEGGELAVLKAIDWSKISVFLWCIETQYHREEIRQFMRSKGYGDQFYSTDIDDFFADVRKAPVGVLANLMALIPREK